MELSNLERPYLEWLASESDAFAATIATPNLELPVAHCPGWQLFDLVGHLGRVQSFWAAAVRAGGDRPGKPSSPHERDAEALREWFDTCSESLRVAVRDIPWDAPAWTWWGEPRTVGAVARHQVQEAAVHRWDAQAAIGEPAAIDAAVAADAVAEFVELGRKLRGPRAVTLHATDTGHDFAAGDDPRVIVNAPAEQLLLLCYGRATPRSVGVEGDRSTLEDFLSKVE